MLVVETIARVRRDFHRRGKSIKQVARERALSRNTVRKVLRTVATAFSYERGKQPGPHITGLERLLEATERRARRERHP